MKADKRALLGASPGERGAAARAPRARLRWGGSARSGHRAASAVAITPAFHPATKAPEACISAQPPQVLKWAQGGRTRSGEGVTIFGTSIRSPVISPATTSPGRVSGTKIGPAEMPSPRFGRRRCDGRVSVMPDGSQGLKRTLSGRGWCPSRSPWGLSRGRVPERCGRGPARADARGSMPKGLKTRRRPPGRFSDQSRRALCAAKAIPRMELRSISCSCRSDGAHRNGRPRWNLKRKNIRTGTRASPRTSRRSAVQAYAREAAPKGVGGVTALSEPIGLIIGRRCIAEAADVGRRFRPPRAGMGGRKLPPLLGGVLQPEEPARTGTVSGERGYSPPRSSRLSVGRRPRARPASAR